MGQETFSELLQLACVGFYVTFSKDESDPKLAHVLRIDLYKNGCHAVETVDISAKSTSTFNADVTIASGLRKVRNTWDYLFEVEED